jgi:hypothetical protein
VADGAFWQANQELHEKVFGEPDSEHELSPFTKALARRYCSSCHVMWGDEAKCSLIHECRPQQNTSAVDFTPVNQQAQPVDGESAAPDPVACLLSWCSVLLAFCERCVVSVVDNGLLG